MFLSGINLKINRKVLIIGVLFLLIVVYYIGCERNNRNQDKTAAVPGIDLPAILKKGKLTILAENSSTSYFIYRGKKMGFEYEILKEFATEIGVDLEIVTITNLDDVNAMLNRGEGDVVACNYTVTNERSKIIDFTVPFLRTNQVLIQRKPDNWETMSANQINSKLLTDPTQLAGKTVNVWGKSTYYQRLVNLQQEIGDTIIIHKETGDFTSEDLIENVSEGIIDYTVVEKNVAQINSHFLDNIDIDLELSVKQKIAFGIRKTSPLLRARINQWLKKFTQKASFKYLKHKYFDLTEIANNVQDPLSSLKGGQLSFFDNYFKQSAAKYNWDWRILASVSYQESKFNPSARGLGGAYGMMQFMPDTGPRFGVYPSSTPQVQIEGGMKLLFTTYKLWNDIPNHDERIKFTLASYNAGTSHVKDAQKLAEKYGMNPKKWDNSVEVMMKNLSKKEYYRDPVVTAGATRGAHTAKYVKTVYARFLSYKSMFR